ncbi:EfeM/EfeO family lipoprotein [Mycolicibacterium litorale]|uniref:EfeM/EfeO family lipoprotein n=1 Tax=Mycolicibacterium litorale TaxID=758802 RepID=UPI003CE7FFFB
MGRQIAWQVPVVALAVVLAGCSSGSEGGGEAETTTTTSAAAAAPSPEAEKAAADYKAYAVEQTDELVGAVKTLTDAVRANNLQAAQEAYAPSRLPWERIEPLAGLVEEIDGKVDARVDDFEGEDDPAFTGWHRLEYLLFAQNTTEGGAQFADQLDADIATLQKQMAAVEVKPVDVSTGAAELIEEVSEGKITGEEDRYSKTDLWDFDANLQGSQAAVNRLSPALATADPALLGEIEAGFSEIFATLEPLRRGDGFVLFCTENDPYPSPRCPEVTVDPATIDKMKAQLAGLSENLSQVSGVLKLT